MIFYLFGLILTLWYFAHLMPLVPILERHDLHISASKPFKLWANHFNDCLFYLYFVRYYSREDTEDAVKYISGTILDDRPIRVDFDWGFQDGRQWGRGRSGGQVHFRICVTFMTLEFTITSCLFPFALLFTGAWWISNRLWSWYPFFFSRVLRTIMLWKPQGLML